MLYFGVMQDIRRDGDLALAELRAMDHVGQDKLAGHNDPGAEAVARLFEHLAG